MKFLRFWGVDSWAPFFENVKFYTTPSVNNSIMDQAWEDAILVLANGFCTKHYTEADIAVGRQRIWMPLSTSFASISSCCLTKTERENICPATSSTERSYRLANRQMQVAQRETRLALPKATYECSTVE